MTSALTGISAEPVIRNSSANVAAAMSASAHGSFCAISALKSARKAACPVTQHEQTGLGGVKAAADARRPRTSATQYTTVSG